MNSTKFSEIIEIKAEPTLLFDYTQDYAKRLQWDTFLIEARLLGDATQAAKGVKAWCVAENGLGMETQYISFNRPKVTAITMTRGPYLFKNFAASWAFTELDLGNTKVTFTYSYSLRFPFMLITPFVKIILRKNVRKRLIDLKRCVENKVL